MTGRCLPPASMPMANAGGPVLSAPEIWTVVWTGDSAIGKAANHFHAELLASDYFSSTMREYGVAAGAAKGVIELDEAPPATITDSSGVYFDAHVKAALGSRTLSGSTVPSPNENTVFEFIVPKTTHEPNGYYHSETNDTHLTATGKSIHVPYIVMRQDHVSYMSDMDYFTWSDSHEIAEVATEPHPFFAAGWNSPWLGMNGEVADLCNDIPVKDSLGTTGDWTLTRVYSAERAAQPGVDPCMPALSGPYTNVVISPGQIVIPRGINQSVTVHLYPFSFDGAQSISWYAVSGNASFTVSPAQGSAAPGQDVSIQVTRVSASPDYPTTFTVWITDPAAPNAPFPLQESFAAISKGM